MLIKILMKILNYTPEHNLDYNEVMGSETRDLSAQEILNRDIFN